MSGSGCYLVCDDCGFQREVDCLDAKWLGTLCPKCGANMLTEADLKKGLAVQEILDLLGLKVGTGDGTKPTVWINPHDDEIKLKFNSPSERG